MAGSRKIYGDITGYPIGSTFANRNIASKSGVHTPTMQGISGNKDEGANSIVVSGQYVDDKDFGEEILYTGMGGRDLKTGRQVKDQSIDQHGNAGLVTSQNQGLPVRVLRGSSGNPEFSPASGFRYHGLFRVTDHWSKLGEDGFRIWQFHLEQLQDQEASAWQPGLPTGNRQPQTQRSMVTRIIRSTEVSNSVKKIYANSCQVCGVTLAIPGGLTSEGAHIRGLGKPHLGPDTPDNVLCLCPNHHTLLDSGGIYIGDDCVVYSMIGEVISQLNVHKNHELSTEHLTYHRQSFGYE